MVDMERSLRTTLAATMLVWQAANVHFIVLKMRMLQQ